MFAAAPSKVPFYVAGGLLALWAVVLAAWGVTHHEFPGSEGRSRLVMLTSFVLVVTTLTAAVLTGGEAAEEEGAAAGEPRATGRTLELAADPGGALAYDRASAAVLAGRVRVRFRNDSDIPHNVTIAEGSRTVGATETITGGSATSSVDLAPGDYDYYCSVPGHLEGGMEGTLTAE